MLDFHQTARRSAVLSAVQKQIFASNGDVLDIDRAVLLTNRTTGAMAVVPAAEADALRPQLTKAAADTGTVFELWIGETGEEELIG